MVEDLIFSNETNYVGRNGMGRQTGIAFARTNDRCIQLAPINSKGATANCSINIPIVNAPAMIKRLQDILNIEKDFKIKRIRGIINEWGETTSTELRLQSSPCISTYGKGKRNHSHLIEGYKLDGVNVAIYNNDLLLDEDYLPYEQLSFEIICEVSEIMEKYYADCFAGTMEE